jgi:hypothetical protein
MLRIKDLKPQKNLTLDNPICRKYKYNQSKGGTELWEPFSSPSETLLISIF